MSYYYEKISETIERLVRIATAFAEIFTHLVCPTDSVEAILIERIRVAVIQNIDGRFELLFVN